MKRFSPCVSRNHSLLYSSTPSLLQPATASSSESDSRVRVLLVAFQRKRQNVQENHEGRAQEALQIRLQRSPGRREQPQCCRQPRLTRRGRGRNRGSDGEFILLIRRGCRVAPVPAVRHDGTGAAVPRHAGFGEAESLPPEASHMLLSAWFLRHIEER